MMTTISVSKEKLGEVISDVEQLVSHFEDLVEEQDKIAQCRLANIKTGKVKGKTEEELDNYLKKRGIKID